MNRTPSVVSIRKGLVFVFVFLATQIFLGNVSGRLLAQAPPVWHSADQKQSNGTGLSLSVYRPSNVSSGDLILLIFTSQISNASTSSVFSTPAGFTLIQTQQDETSTLRPEVVAFF